MTVTKTPAKRKKSNTVAAGADAISAVPTLVHVAVLAGVGLGTASRALSGQGYVSQETSARILQAVTQLGYQRNELARSLKSVAAARSVS